MAGEMEQLASTAIGKAILGGNLADLRVLINRTDHTRKMYYRVEDEEDVMYRDKKGNTYLHYISSMNRPFLFHQLVAHGIDINAKNKDGNTALHVSALCDEPCHVPDLMACGIDPFIINNDGKTAMEIRTKNKYWGIFYEKYKPGVFKCVEDRDIERLKYLMSCWCKVNVARNGQLLVQLAASKKFTDIVMLIDQMKPTLEAVYGVLEGDSQKLKKALEKPTCDVNFTNQVSAKPYLLQHALSLGDPQIVSILCRAGAEVNARVLVQRYLRAPLYFEVINTKTSNDIIMTVLTSGADLNRKDEHGRTPLLYALDKTNGDVSLALIQFFIDKGVNISERDDTGLCIRDTARLARRQDIVDAVDKHLINLFRSSNMAALEALAVEAYDGFFFEYNYRDSLLYSAGNETDHVYRFLKGWPQYQETVNLVHKAAAEGRLDALKNLLDDENQNKYLRAQTKSGRTPIMTAVLFGQVDAVKYLLQLNAQLGNNVTDNLGRTPLYYAAALNDEEGLQLLSVLLSHGADPKAIDVCNNTALDYVWERTSPTGQEVVRLLPQTVIEQSATDNLKEATDAESYNGLRNIGKKFIQQEKKRRYGMDIELKCVDKYEHLRAILTDQVEEPEDFEEALENSGFSVADFPRLLEPGGNELLRGFKDLLFLAMEEGKESVAKKLVLMGADCIRKEKCDIVQADGLVYTFNMSGEERARNLGMTDLADLILYTNLKNKGLDVTEYTCTRDYAVGETDIYIPAVP